MNWLINFSLHNRLVVLTVVAVVMGVGAWSLQYIDIDAFPDTTPVMVQINTTTPTLSPEEVERQVTFPIEQVISGLPGLEKLRSISKFGLSQVVVTFEEGTDIYFARQLINERLTTVELPQGIERPRMGPVSTGLGEVFHYVVRLDDVDLSGLSREMQIEKLTELARFTIGSSNPNCERSVERRKSTLGVDSKSSTRSGSILTSCSNTN